MLIRMILKYIKSYSNDDIGNVALQKTDMYSYILELVVKCSVSTNDSHYADVIQHTSTCMNVNEIGK